MRFYERLEIKDLISYLRLILNPNDDLSFRRIINRPKRSIGEKALKFRRICKKTSNFTF